MFKAYERLREHEPNSIAAQLGMAQAEWMLHHFEKAAEIFQRLAQTRQMPAKAWLDYARLEMERQVQQGQPDWAEFQVVLGAAEKANPDAVEVPLLKAQWQMLHGDLDEARQMLTEAQAEKIWKDSAELWTARISLELRDKKRIACHGAETSPAKRNSNWANVWCCCVWPRRDLLAEENGKGSRAGDQSSGRRPRRFQERNGPGPVVERSGGHSVEPAEHDRRPAVCGSGWRSCRAVAAT